MAFLDVLTVVQALDLECYVQELAPPCALKRRYVQTAPVGDEADIAAAVRAHEAEQDHLTLAALEGVHTGHEDVVDARVLQPAPDLPHLGWSEGVRIEFSIPQGEDHFRVGEVYTFHRLIHVYASL